MCDRDVKMILQCVFERTNSKYISWQFLAVITEKLYCWNGKEPSAIHLLQCVFTEMVNDLMTKLSEYFTMKYMKRPAAKLEDNTTASLEQIA